MLSGNEIAHWQTSLVAERLDALVGVARDHRLTLVSPGPVDATPLSLGFRTGSLARDPDGHGIRLVVR